MKIKFHIAASVSTVLTLHSALGQGALTPPGAPAPVMKSLDQIEARTIVNSANTPGDGTNLFIISQPGSYYLTANVVPFRFLGGTAKNGIEITANNVTLDLNGFAMQGAMGNSGIYIPYAQTNITVRNGTISGWAANGIDSASSSSWNQVFERLNISTCGDDGVTSYGTAAVRDCNCENNTEDGIDCFGGGIISGCMVNKNGFDGIQMGGGTISGCSVQLNGNIGILVVVGSTVSGCYVEWNTANGIFLDATGCAVIGNTCYANNIAINDSNNRVEGNHVTVNGYAGIQVYAGGLSNVIIKNSVSGNGAGNYVVPAGNDLGPVGTAATATSPWANISH
jgi:parallel beta-helix repeat protein